MGTDEQLSQQQDYASPDSELLDKIKEPVEDSDEALFDGIIGAIGSYGTFQNRFNLIFNFVMIAVMTMPYLNLVLAMSVPEHHCHVPGRNETLYTLQEWQAKTIPLNVDPKTGKESLSSCSYYSKGNETSNCAYGWDYDTTWYALTAPSMQDWVCENELYVTNTFVASRVGEIIGIFCFGQLGDRIGRRPVFFISLTLLVLGRCLTVFTSHIYYLFLAVVMLGSTSTVSVFQTPMIIGLEVSDAKKRSYIGFMHCAAWVLGNCALPLLAWVISDWRTMVFVTTLPSAAAFFLYKLMPESPRWLAGRGRVEDAERVLRYIAKTNKAELPKNTREILEHIGSKKDKTYGIPSLFANKRLAKNTIMIIVCWVVCGLSYYSLVLNISNMAGNPFMNFFWQGLVELPGYVIGKYLSNKIGRRWTHTCSYFIAIALCSALIVSHGSAAWVTTLFVTFVKFSFTVSFYMVWLQAMEVYPTCVRQTGISIGGLASNIIGVIGPYIVYLGTSVDTRLPYVLLLCLASLGALCSSILPETLNKKLPETLEDAKNFGQHQKFWSFNKTKRLK